MSRIAGKVSARFGLTQTQKNHVLQIAQATKKLVTPLPFMHVNWQLSDSGFRFIKAREGLRLRMYPDSGGKLTIGYGHLVNDKAFPAYRDGIDQKTAERLLHLDVAFVVELLNHVLAGYILQQHQFDALVSFAFNVGTSAFLESTLFQDIRKHNLSDIPAQMLRWEYVNHEYSEGLEHRRTLEGALFKDGQYE